MSKLTSKETSSIITFFKDIYNAHLADNSTHTWESFNAGSAKHINMVSAMAGLVPADVLPVIQDIIAAGSIENALELEKIKAMSRSSGEEEKKNKDLTEQADLLDARSQSEETFRQDAVKRAKAQEEEELATAISNSEEALKKQEAAIQEALETATAIAQVASLETQVHPIGETVDHSEHAA